MNDTGTISILAFADIWENFKPVYVSFTTVLGLTGNGLSAIVFLRHKNWQPAGLHYLFFLALSDSSNLIFYVLNGVNFW